MIKQLKNKTVAALLRVSLITVSLLLLPLIAMQFTDEVNWQAADFIVAGLLLFVTGFVLELIIAKVKPTSRKLLAGALLIGLFLYVWAELAVGVFTNLGS